MKKTPAPGPAPAGQANFFERAFLPAREEGWSHRLYLLIFHHEKPAERRFDLLTILPTYLSILFAGSSYLIVIRALWLLRIFRVLKLVDYSSEASVLIGSLVRSSRKIVVFICAAITIVVTFGSLMYVIEGTGHGFTSIPTSMYWAVVTMATVGFGDIAPLTPLGRFITSILILIGYSIIAVPTGSYTAGLASSLRQKRQVVGCGPCTLHRATLIEIVAATSQESSPHAS